DNLDQRGFVRPGTGAANCCIGAFEANSMAPTASTATNTPLPTSTATNTPSTAAATRTPTQTPTIMPVATIPRTPAPTAMPTSMATGTPTITPTAPPLPLVVNGSCMEPGSEGLVPCTAGMVVTAYLCTDRSCAAATLSVLAVTQTDTNGQ